MHVQSSGKHEISAGNVLASLFREDESQAVFLLRKQGVSRLDITRYLSHGARKNKALPMRPTGPDGESDEAIKRGEIDVLEFRKKKAVITAPLRRKLGIETVATTTAT